MTTKENTISMFELRLGNWVFENDKPIWISQISGFKSLNSGNDFYPIPLTEEILLKIEGIEKDNEWYSLTNLHYNSLTKRFYIGNDHVSSGHDDAYIEYLHQLQNLYFALTNEELKITL
ncbi:MULTISPECIES: hypothetical protein [unclassified Empedobacter]|uniref:hypothetical protein n=1 Tax=unclassified Empedobacter TaxID=2643773 RepID=UPI0025C4489D|nr:MULTISPECIES: hypothetical protein [unclassified Empedobacter]